MGRKELQVPSVDFVAFSECSFCLRHCLGYPLLWHLRLTYVHRLQTDIQAFERTYSSRHLMVSGVSFLRKSSKPASLWSLLRAPSKKKIRDDSSDRQAYLLSSSRRPGGSQSATPAIGTSPSLATWNSPASTVAATNARNISKFRDLFPPVMAVMTASGAAWCQKVPFGFDGCGGPLWKARASTLAASSICSAMVKSEHERIIR